VSHEFFPQEGPPRITGRASSHFPIRGPPVFRALFPPEGLQNISVRRPSNSYAPIDPRFRICAHQSDCKSCRVASWVRAWQRRTGIRSLVDIDTIHCDSFSMQMEVIRSHSEISNALCGMLSNPIESAQMFDKISSRVMRFSRV